MLVCIIPATDVLCVNYYFAFNLHQEEELRKGGEAKYAHLAMELHVFIEVMAPIPEAYVRMAHAMEEVKKFLIPVCVQDNFLHPSYRSPLCTSNSTFAFHICKKILLWLTQGTVMHN